MLAAAEAGDLKRVRALVAEGSDLDVRDDNGNSPLAWAAHEGHPDVARLLLDRGASVDNEDGGSNTPLIWAAVAESARAHSYQSN